MKDNTLSLFLKAFGVVIITLLCAFAYLLYKSARNQNSKKYFDFKRDTLSTLYVKDCNTEYKYLLDATVLYNKDSLFITKNEELDECKVIEIGLNKSTDIVIPKTNYSVKHLNDNCLYLLSNLKLSKYDLRLKTENSFLAKSIDLIIDAVFLESKEFLLFGVDTIGSQELHFSRYRTNKGDIDKGITAKVLNNRFNDRKYYENMLAYDGTFSKAFNYIVYTCYHLPYIYIFNDKGEFQKTITTKDNVPYPSIIRYKDYYVFERGATFNSNISGFIYRNKLCVFSYRTSYENSYTIDIYELEQDKYIGSVFIQTDYNTNNQDIDQVIYLDNRILIKGMQNILILDTALLNNILS